jgi:hypothetical protein
MSWVGMLWSVVACGPISTDAVDPIIALRIADDDGDFVSLRDERGDQTRRVGIEESEIVGFGGWIGEGRVLLVEAVSHETQEHTLWALDHTGASTQFETVSNAGRVQSIRVLGAAGPRILVSTGLLFAQGYWSGGTGAGILDVDSPEAYQWVRGGAQVSGVVSPATARAFLLNREDPATNMPDEEGPLRAWVVDMDSGDMSVPDEHDPSTGDELPSWSPDGTRMVFAAADGELHLLAQDGTGREQLTHTSSPERLPAWSPIGEQIAFIKGPQQSSQLCVIRADGTADRELAVVTTTCAPVWNPRGDTLAVLGDGRVHVVALDGTIRVLADVAGNFQWSSDGQRLAYDRPASSGGGVVVLELETDDELIFPDALAFALR